MTSVLIASSIRIVLVALFAALLVRAFRIRHPATLHGLWFAVAAVMLRPASPRCDACAAS